MPAMPNNCDSHLLFFCNLQDFLSSFNSIHHWHLDIHQNDSIVLTVKLTLMISFVVIYFLNSLLT